ncbi:MAG: MFS transporter [Mycoplasmoidaceae bacterium]
MFLDQINLKIFINLIILVIVLIIALVILWKLKFENKGYKYLFLLYIIIWIPIMLVRPYRGPVQAEIDNLLKWIPLMLYGLIGVFARPLMDFTALYFKNRKVILQSAILIILITYLPIIFFQSTATNIIQTLGVGIGASIIGIYELLFKEQYGKSKALLTVSILAIPPLVADFITAPIQSMIASFAKNVDAPGYDISKLAILWIIGVGFLILALVMAFFVKEQRAFVGMNFGNKVIENKNDQVSFLLICLIGAIILFIKFGNSGSVGTTRLHELGKLTNMDVSGYEGYLSTVFSTFQLLGTFLFGYCAIKNFSTIKIFMIGFIIWMFYHFISIFYFNPIFFFSIHALNGFAYGILYNLFLGYILSLSFKNKLITPMGIYQAILAIGITLSNFFTTFISSNLMLDLRQATIIIDTTIMALLVLSLILLIYVEKKVHYQKR